MPRYLLLSAVLLTSLVFPVPGFAEEGAVPPPPAPAKEEIKAPAPETKNMPVATTAATPAGTSDESAVAAPAPVSIPPVVPVPSAAPAKTIKPVGCVSELDNLVSFHKKEIVSLDKMISRWNARLQSYMDRRDNIDDEISSLTKDAAAKRSADPKLNKKEIARLEKQIGRLKKDRAGIDKDLKKQCAEMAGEIKEMTKETSAALKERYQQVQKTIESN